MNHNLATCFFKNKKGEKIWTMKQRLLQVLFSCKPRRKRNVLDDILTIYENYVVRKVSNEGFSNKVDEVLKNYSIPEAVALGCICSLIEEQKNKKKKLLKDINMFFNKR